MLRPISTTYGYDSQNRLTSAVGSASNSYSYDPVGNQGSTSTNCATTGTFSVSRHVIPHSRRFSVVTVQVCSIGREACSGLSR